MPMVSSAANAYIGTGIVSAYHAGSKLVTFWEASKAYVVGDLVLNFDDSPAVGVLPIQLYKCTTGGTSAASGGPTGVGVGITDGTVTWAREAVEDRGDCEEFAIEGESEEKELMWHRGGRVEVARTDETRRKLSLKVTLKEFTIENIATVGLGTIIGTSPNRLIKMGGASRPNLLWQFEGKNDFGPRYQVVIPSLRLNVPNSMGFLQEDYASMEASGKLTALPDGNFFYITELGDA